MLGHPEGFVIQPIHQDGDSLGLVKDGGQMFVGQPAVIDRGSVQSDVVKVHVAGKQAAKLGNHNRSPPRSKD